LRVGGGHRGDANCECAHGRISRNNTKPLADEVPEILRPGDLSSQNTTEERLGTNLRLERGSPRPG
jgi:hypothetical protein